MYSLFVLVGHETTKEVFLDMIYGSVCSGIEAASVAWEPLGWKASFFSEIEKFPRAVLEHHYPDTPLHGDFTTIKEGQYEPIELLVGGTPCQSFSVAGLRKGMDDERGNLALEYLRLAQRLGPRWLVWENVPGVLSSNGGRDFGSFLGALVELGYGWSYRILDAQYFGVPQRRRRVFVVAYLGDWRPAAAVLFERESLFRNTPPSRESRIEESNITTSCGEVTPTLSWRDYKGPSCGRDGFVGVLIATDKGVRKATLKEYERAFGFPDNYTQIPWRNKSPENCPDGPRYKALGNSMAVPVMRWIGKRIQAVDELKG